MLGTYRQPMNQAAASQRLGVRQRLATMTPEGCFVAEEDMEFAIDVAIRRGDDWALGWLAIKYQAIAVRSAG
jgi:hypothetical protein